MIKVGEMHEKMAIVV